MSDLGKAISITSLAFIDKVDKGGKPYILHCLHVMHKVRAFGDEVMMIAVMHDLVEDTTWTIEALRSEGFSERVLAGVEIMTHRKGVPYDEYIKIIATNEDTRAVKKEDLKHNSDITRMKGLTKKDFDRLEKYNRSYAYLDF